MEVVRIRPASELAKYAWLPSSAAYPDLSAASSSVSASAILSVATAPGSKAAVP